MRAKMTARLEDLPNVGPSIASDLRRVGVYHPCDLIGQQPDELYRALCETTGVRHDPCVLDVFIAAVRFAEGEPARPWWHSTAERKQRYAAVTARPSPPDPPAVRAISRTRPGPPFHAR
jgi:hypothetical protein